MNGGMRIAIVRDYTSKAISGSTERFPELVRRRCGAECCGARRAKWPAWQLAMASASKRRCTKVHSKTTSKRAYTVIGHHGAPQRRLL